MSEKRTEETQSIAQILGRNIVTGFCDPEEGGCDKEFEYVQLAGITRVLCDKCHENKFPTLNNAQQMAIERAAKKKRDWEKICPKAYRTIEEDGETDMNRLKSERGDKLVDVLLWQPNAKPRGLVLHGITGLCKTRVIWRLLRRIHDSGLKIRVFNCSEFSDECTESFRLGNEHVWRESIYQADVVFFDDLWKDRWTDRVDSELFKVLEKLSHSGKPYFITTNWVGEALEKRALQQNSGMSIDRLRPLLRRLREDCRLITFNESANGNNTQH